MTTLLSLTSSKDLDCLPAYHTYLFRQELTGHSVDLLVLSEDRLMSITHNRMVIGGISRAINISLLRGLKSLSLHDSIILLAKIINGETYYQKIGIKRKKGLSSMISWATYRTTFGRAGDLPLEIIGITDANSDETQLANTLKNESSSKFMLTEEIMD